MQGLWKVVAALGCLVLICAFPISASTSGSLTFRDSQIALAAATYAGGNHLGEAMISSEKTGFIYVSGYSPTAQAATAHAPVFFSGDNGTSWSLLTTQFELGGIEGDVASDSAGNAWLLDNVPAVGLPLYGWCADGRPCTSVADVADHSTTSPCSGFVADRPWVEYGANKLVMVNNNGGSLQLGVRDLILGSSSWNTCVAQNILAPSTPAIRESDSKIAVSVAKRGAPNTFEILYGSSVSSLTSSGNLATPNEMCHSHNGGPLDFAADGALWGALRTSERAITVVRSTGPGSFTTSSFDVVGNGWKILYYHISASPPTGNAFLTWATTTSCEEAPQPASLYGARLVVGSGGSVNLTDISEIDSGINGWCADFMTSEVDPAGNALVVLWSVHSALVQGLCSNAAIGQKPLHVFIQDQGPRI